MSSASPGVAAKRQDTAHARWDNGDVLQSCLLLTNTPAAQRVSLNETRPPSWLIGRGLSKSSDGDAIQ